MIAPTFFDRLTGIISPKWELSRLNARHAMATAFGVGGGEGPYGGASSKRSLRSWGVSYGDADSDLLDSLEILRGRTRDLYRNNPLARGALRTVRTNVVGGGLRLNCQIDRDKLGMTDEAAEAWERQTEREFNLWADSQFCDVTLNDNFYGLQGMVCLAALMSGDVFALLPWVHRAGSPYDLRVQLVEGDRVCNPNLRADTDRIAGGIESDQYGAPVTYHICTPHPGRSFAMKQLKWQAVPAFGAKTGRRNVLHIFERERPDQRRGVPYLTPVIESLKQLGRYTEAELMAAVVSGMFTVFIQSETGDGLDVGFDPMTDPDVGPVPPGGPVGGDYKLAPGAIVGLAPGETVHESNPGRPNPAFDPFIMAILRQVGAGLEIPFELLIKHFSASYSASRAALLEAWKFFRQRRGWLVSMFCDPIYAAWMTEAVIKGRIKAPGFLTDPAVAAAYLGAEWVGPSMGQIDPWKEANAAKMRVEECFSTRSREAAEITGGDFENVVRRRGREESMREQYGLSDVPITPAPPAVEDSGDDQGDDSNTRKKRHPSGGNDAGE